MFKLKKTIIIILTLLYSWSFVMSEVLQEVIVKEGDTLWSVANYYLKDPKRWPEILKYNKLSSTDPNIILPGMKLSVPILLIKEHLRAARLIYYLNDVRYHRKNDAQWKDVWDNMELYNEDGLRTLRESVARVKFPSGETLRIDENSLIILRPDKKREEIDLLSGAVRASKTKILSSGSEVDPRIVPRGKAPDFKTKVTEDRTTLVEVYEGIVDVTAQGKTVTLTKGLGTEVKFKKAPSLPMRLPPQAEMKNTDGSTILPGTKFVSSDKTTSESLELDIKVPEAGKPDIKSEKDSEHKSQVLGAMISKYHIQVSTSYDFEIVIMDETHKIEGKVKFDFKKYNLSDGIYFYRIAYVDELGFEGKFSTPVRFSVDMTAPFITLKNLTEGQEIDGDFIHVEGETEKNASLDINDKPVSVENGSFFTALTPKKGRNQITIIAKDKAGNITKKEIMVFKVKKASKSKPLFSRGDEKASEKGSKTARIAMASLTITVILGVLVLLFKS